MYRVNASATSLEHLTALGDMVPLSAFDDPAQKPRDEVLSRTLGGTARLWRQVIENTSADHGATEAAWHFAGAKFGWSLRLKRNGRILLYLIPQQSEFLVGVVLGETAVEAAHTSSLPKRVVAMLDEARAYAEGRGIRLPVKSAGDVSAVRTLLALKTAGTASSHRHKNGE